jgi:integrase
MRRIRGSGGISKRSDGRFQASYVGADGRRHYLYGQTRRAVSDRLTAAIRDRDLGLIGTSQTVGSFMASWLRQLHVAPRTRERYEGQIRLHVLPTLGALPLRRLTPQHLSELYASLTLSPASIAHLHAVIHGALDQAMKWNLIARNPASAVKAPRAKRRPMTVYTPDEARALLRALAGDDLEALYVLALMTGARQGELLAMTWRDVEPGWLNVRGTKSTAAVRRVALSSIATESLRRHRLRMAERLLPFRARPEGDTLVFLTELGEPYNGSHVTERMFKPLLRRHGLREIRFHDLRHACASFHLGIGTPVHVVSEMLGHSSPAVTLGIYAHVIPGDQEDAAARLDAVLGA